MSETRSGPIRIGLEDADDPRDVVHQAVACLGQGGVVALPSESSYVLAAKALEPTAVARLRAIKGISGGRPLALGLRGAGEILDWVPDLSDIGRKFARRA